MTVSYKGKDADYNYRIAEIFFDDETEQKIYERIEKVMKIRGWELNQVTNGYASCKVDNMEEYRDFVKDYKEVKKSVKLWEKFGF